VVVELGYGTAGVAVGDEVYGLIDGYRDGAAAELMAIEARDVAPAPTTIDHPQAASRPQAGLTSWQALFDHGQLTSGRTVMIHAAGGAVGSIAVQLAKAKGLRVVGTGRSKVKPLVLDLGADEFVDVEQDGWQDDVEHLAVVFDTLGGDVLARSVGIVKPGGTTSQSPHPHRPIATTSARSTSFATRAVRSSSRSLSSSTRASSGRKWVGSMHWPKPARR
jgi:NADPH:quinone reductase-like Zn-dependent oxidoreductase